MKKTKYQTVLILQITQSLFAELSYSQSETYEYEE